MILAYAILASIALGAVAGVLGTFLYLIKAEERFQKNLDQDRRPAGSEFVPTILT